MKCNPISAINNKNAIITQKIIVQPITDSGIKRMKLWLMEETWECVITAPTADLKAEAFQDTFVTKFNEYFPNKTLKLSNVDQPWITQKLKKLNRQCKRVYNKTRRSEKWKKKLDDLFKKEVKAAKANFYRKIVLDLKEKNPSIGIVQ